MVLWILVDVSVIVVCYFYIFYKLDVEIIDWVVVGESVKLIFVFDIDNFDVLCVEWFWVMVEGIEVDGVFSGCLDNYL